MAMKLSELSKAQLIKAQLKVAEANEAINDLLDAWPSTAEGEPDDERNEYMRFEVELDSRANELDDAIEKAMAA